MSTVFMMTARMCTIATACVVLLCLVLFAIGVQVGQRLEARAAPAGDRGDRFGGVAASAPLPAVTAPVPASAGAGER